MQHSLQQVAQGSHSETCFDCRELPSLRREFKYEHFSYLKDFKPQKMTSLLAKLYASVVLGSTAGVAYWSKDTTPSSNLSPTASLACSTVMFVSTVGVCATLGLGGGLLSPVLVPYWVYKQMKC